jgi:hypothetical protein
MKNKLISIILTLSLILAFTACSNEPPADEDIPEMQNLRTTEFITHFGYTTSVVYDGSILSEEDALIFADSTVLFLHIFNDGNITDMDSWAEPWADIYEGNELKSVLQINLTDMSLNSSTEAAFQAIAYCIFDDDENTTEVAIDYIYVDGIMGGPTFGAASYGEGNFVFHDIYFIK